MRVITQLICIHHISRSHWGHYPHGSKSPFWGHRGHYLNQSSYLYLISIRWYKPFPLGSLPRRATVPFLGHYPHGCQMSQWGSLTISIIITLLDSIARAVPIGVITHMGQNPLFGVTDPYGFVARGGQRALGGHYPCWC